MRVIAGSWKGRRLKSPASDAVRPTTDRVKEALFNILGPDVTGCLFVDLCCGAGGLGIEALSRGAAGAIFVDQAPRSLNSARANLEICGADFERIRTQCYPTGASYNELDTTVPKKKHPFGGVSASI